MNQVRISELDDARIVEFPYSKLTVVGNGKPGVQGYEGIIARRDWPYLPKILKVGFLDVPKMIERDSDLFGYLRNNYGFGKDMNDIEAGVSFYIIKPESWQNSPTIGGSFYGIVAYEDAATLSDFIKGEELGDDLITSGVSQVIVGNQRMVLGEASRLHRWAYLSHPIRSIRTISSKCLERVLLDETKTDKEKSAILLAL